MTRRRVNLTCSQCDASAHAHGLCHTHYARLRKHGDPTVSLRAVPLRSETNGNWVGENAGYKAVHKRKVAESGKASTHHCAGTCGGMADEWALIGSDTDDKVDDRGRPYSTDLSRYEPLCIHEHRLMDHPSNRVAA